MNISAINSVNYGYTSNNVNISRPKTNEMERTNIKSIYSKGMSQVAFGAIPHVKTSFAKEIAEQPKVLSKIINNFLKDETKVSGVNLNLTKEEVQKASAINIVASGSSKNAGEMAKPFIEAVADTPVNIMSASEFITAKPKINNNDIMVFISQSGNTADTLNALNHSKSQGLKTIAITNNSESKIHKAADFAMDMGAGEENAVAATKTVTSSVANLWGLGMKLGEIKESFSLASEKGKNIVTAMKKIPQQIEEMVHNTSQVDSLAEKTANKENFYFLAKEPNLGAVNEGALKLTETTQKRIIPGSSSEFMHGLFTSIKPNDVFVEVATGKPESKSYNLAVENFKEIVKKRDVQTPVLIKNETNKGIESEIKDAHFVDVPETEETLSPILTTVRFQQLTNSITKKLGINPDNGGGVLTKYRQNLSM